MMQLWRAGLLVLLLLATFDAERAWGEPGEASASKPDYSACQKAAFRVIVDVGHTAQVPGATSARGVPEYAFNLRLARLIEQKLVDAGFARTVLLITAEAPYRGLLKRVVHANREPADLFVSIHHDSVPAQFFQTWEYEGKERRFSDRFRGHSIFISHDNGDRKGSLQFGRLLGLQLKERGLQYTPHYTEEFMGRRQRELLDAEAGVYRYDQLVVLKDTRMPAVLLEAGSIVNREEELLLGSPEHQALIGAAVTEAVEGFCALRQKDQIARRIRALRVAKPAARPASASDQASSIKRHEP